ncbi:hypothetical protein HAT93_03250 [Dickeya solani]|nr:hypothetical protein [Dickeya solani]
MAEPPLLRHRPQGPALSTFSGGFPVHGTQAARWWWARDPAWRAKGVADPLININVLQDAFKTDAPQAQSATLAISHCRESDYFIDADIATRWESDTINIYITRGADRQLKLHITCCCFNQDGMDRFLQLLRQQLSSLG